MNGNLFMKGSLSAEVVSPGIFRFERRDPSKREQWDILVANLNTGYAVLQEDTTTQTSLADSTLGLTRPFQILTRGQMEYPAPGEENKAAAIFREGKEFLKHYTVTLEASMEAQEAMRRFLDKLQDRDRVKLEDIKPGDTVALFDHEDRIYLMHVLSETDWEHGPVLNYEGFVALKAPNGRLQYEYFLARDSKGSMRFLWEDDRIVRVAPEELTPFLFPDGRSKPVESPWGKSCEDLPFAPYQEKSGQLTGEVFL